jgi:2-methylcitrate dehydratase PrpD
MVDPIIERRADDSTHATAAIVRHALDFDFDALPEDVIRFAKHCVVDFVATAIAGSTEPVARLLLDEALEEGGAPRASVIGQREWVTPRQAALINGTAGHALDYDDTNFTMNGHITVASLPALLALAEAAHLRGDELIVAYLAGVDAGCRVGLLVEPGHYLAGFHATGTLGTFAAAAGCARLLKLPQDLAQQAIGLAATHASGLKAMFGTMGKPYHAGRAAQTGLNAVKLAARGFAGRDNMLETHQGFAATHSPDFNIVAALNEPKRGFHVRSTLFKYHAACYGVHASIEAGLQIRQMTGFDLADVRRVSVEVGAVNGDVCNIQEPRTPHEARFSIRLMAAYGLTGWDTSRLDSFEPERVNAPEIVALRNKITVVLRGDLEITFARMRVELDDGQQFDAEVELGIPATDLDRQESRLTRKFNALVTPRLGQPKAEALLAMLLRLESVPDVTQLASLWSEPLDD